MMALFLFYFGVTNVTKLIPYKFKKKKKGKCSTKVENQNDTQDVFPTPSLRRLCLRFEKFNSINYATNWKNIPWRDLNWEVFYFNKIIQINKNWKRQPLWQTNWIEEGLAEMLSLYLWGLNMWLKIKSYVSSYNS